MLPALGLRAPTGDSVLQLGQSIGDISEKSLWLKFVLVVTSAPRIRLRG